MCAIRICCLLHQIINSALELIVHPLARVLMAVSVIVGPLPIELVIGEVSLVLIPVSVVIDSVP